MKAPWSLSRRLVVYLLIAQLVGFVSLPLVSFVFLTTGLTPGAKMFLRDWGQPHAEELLIGSLRRAPDGSAYIERTPALRAYVEENPGVQFAAFDGGFTAALPGSSLELVSALGGMGHIQANLLKFHISGDPDPDSRGLLRRVFSPAGEFFVAAYGYTFHLADVGYMAITYLNVAEFLTFAPMILAAVIMVWFVVRSGLAPLRAAAIEASRIDMESLDQRIAKSGIPREVTPFVDAVNEALARLNAGVATQRRFIANAAHELRTPIAILRARIDNSDFATVIEELKHDVRRIQMIVEQLLASARISNRENSIDEDVDLGEAILEMVADYMPLVIEKRRYIEFEAPPLRVMVRGNRRGLEGVAANLIDNALRAEPEGGTILVRVMPGATIEVIDHGEGIAPSDREMIFEPFWRKDDKTPGTGLGLSIAKELIELHGGTISVGPTPGGGATFRVALKEIASENRRRSEVHLSNSEKAAKALG